MVISALLTMLVCDWRENSAEEEDYFVLTDNRCKKKLQSDFLEIVKGKEKSRERN